MTSPAAHVWVRTPSALDDADIRALARARDASPLRYAEDRCVEEEQAGTGRAGRMASVDTSKPGFEVSTEAIRRTLRQLSEEAEEKP